MAGRVRFYFHGGNGGLLAEFHRSQATYQKPASSCQIGEGSAESSGSAEGSEAEIPICGYLPQMEHEQLRKTSRHVLQLQRHPVEALL